MMKKAQFALQQFYAALREIFDEAAYERYLRRRGERRSRETYGAFVRELAVQKQRRPRCC